MHSQNTFRTVMKGTCGTQSLFVCGSVILVEVVVVLTVIVLVLMTKYAFFSKTSLPNPKHLSDVN